ncbi:MAG: hypothetical protein VX252_05970 [Myxococcota bacterium]|nr:hypothetical protein [Myxococcota bacterium]
MDRKTTPPAKLLAHLPWINHRLTGVIFACLLAITSGCNAPGPRTGDAPKLPYFQARAYDLLDIVDVNFGAGTGMLAAVAVEPLRVGLGTYESTRIGTFRRSVGIWDEDRKEFFMIHELNKWEKEPHLGNGYLFTPTELHRHNKPRDPKDYSRSTFYEKWGWTARYQDWERPWLDVDVNVHLLFVGVAIGVSPQEAVDFALGIFGIDVVSHDDYGPAPEIRVDDEDGDIENSPS